MPELELPPGEESWIFSLARNARWVSDQLLKHDAADERLDKLISEEAKLNWERFSENRSLAQSTLARVAALEAAGDVSLPTRFHEYELLCNSRQRKMGIKQMLLERRIAALEEKLEEPVAERTRYRKQRPH